MSKRTGIWWRLHDQYFQEIRGFLKEDIAIWRALPWEALKALVLNDEKVAWPHVRQQYSDAATYGLWFCGGRRLAVDCSSAELVMVYARSAGKGRIAPASNGDLLNLSGLSIDAREELRQVRQHQGSPLSGLSDDEREQRLYDLDVRRDALGLEPEYDASRRPPFPKGFQAAR